MPFKGQRLSSAVVDDVIYIFGGESAPGVWQDGILRFDPESKSVTQVAYLPYPLSGMGAVTVGGAVYLFGGWRDYAAVKDIMRFNPSTGEVAKIGELPEDCVFASAAVVNEKVYIFGGRNNNGENIRDIVEYDPGSNTVTKVACLPYPLNGGAAAAWNGSVFLFGGSSTMAGDVGDVFKFDPQTRGLTWWMNRLPAPRCAAAAVASERNGVIYLIGGYSDYFGLFPDVLAYNPDSHTVVTAAYMPAGRCAHTAEIIGDNFYVIGGGSYQGLLNDISSFELAPPEVQCTDPASGDANVPVDKTVTVTFSEDVIQGDNFSRIALEDAAGRVAAASTGISGRVLTIDPETTLAYSTSYTVSIPAAAVKDLTGNTPAQDFSFCFTTEAASTGGGGGGGGGTPLPFADRIEVPVPAGADAVVELTGRVKVEVPAGAITGANARLQLAVLPDSEAVSILSKAKNVQAASPVIDIKLRDGQVSGAITVVFSYDPGKVTSGRVPALYFYSEKKNCWVYLGGKADPDSRTVSLDIFHLSRFAVFARDPVPVFSDMQGHWAGQAVARLAGMGVISGFPGNVFKPGAEMSRAECTAMLVRALDLEIAGEEQLVLFKDSADIPPWARGPVAAAVKAGLVKGYPVEDGEFTFRAGNPVTRGELAVLLEKIAAKEAGPVTGPVIQFADKDTIPGWAREAAGAVAARGIVKGYEDGTFRAADHVKRAEGAAMILRLLNLVYAL
ncbi:MAG: S-layer homology domain-containing protein [Bacillota bacterium]